VFYAVSVEDLDMCLSVLNETEDQDDSNCIANWNKITESYDLLDESVQLEFSSSLSIDQID